MLRDIAGQLKHHMPFTLLGAAGRAQRRPHHHQE